MVIQGEGGWASGIVLEKVCVLKTLPYGWKMESVHLPLSLQGEHVPLSIWTREHDNWAKVTQQGHFLLQKKTLCQNPNLPRKDTHFQWLLLSIPDVSGDYLSSHSSLLLLANFRKGQADYLW